MRLISTVKTLCRRWMFYILDGSFKEKLFIRAKEH